MKETVKINLNQRLFDLDADAYSRLRDYLDTLRNYFQSKNEEAEEIIQDIEQRIAEILQERLKEEKQVITLTDIEEIIQMMGTIDDFAREDNGTETEDRQENNESTRHGHEDYSRDNRRLYRDLESNIVGGVCAGTAAYFNIDPVWIRLAFVLLCFLNGVGFIVYIILWAIVPAARTTAQRLQMKGRPVTIENIQESVKSEYGKVKDNFKRYSQSENFRKTKDAANEVFSTLGQIIVAFLKVILVIIGVICSIALIAFLLGLLGVITLGGNYHGLHFHGFNLNNQIAPFFHDMTLFSVALTLVIIIPVIAILAGIIKMVLNVKTRNGVLSAFAWTFWSLALVYVLISVITGDRHITEMYHQKHEYKLEIDNYTTLYIKADKLNISNWRTEYYTFFGKEIIHDKSGDLCYLQPRLYIRSSNDDEARIRIEQTSVIPYFGDNSYKNEYDYSWNMNDSLLLLDNYFSLDEDVVWLIPGMTVTIFLPEGQKVVMNPNLSELISVYSDDENEYLTDKYNNMLTIEDGRLVELDSSDK